MSSYTSAFTITHAQYLASKVGADLKQMQLFYGRPTDVEIADYVQELVVFLKAGYLTSIDYAFKKNDTYIVGVSYEVDSVRGTLVDNSPGRITPGKDITGARFSTFRRPSPAYLALSGEDKAAFDNTNPVKWSGAPDPLSGNGGIYDKTYSAGGQQLNRKTF